MNKVNPIRSIIDDMNALCLNDYWSPRTYLWWVSLSLAVKTVKCIWRAWVDNYKTQCNGRSRKICTLFCEEIKICSYFYELEYMKKYDKTKNSNYDIFCSLEFITLTQNIVNQRVTCANVVLFQFFMPH